MSTNPYQNQMGPPSPPPQPPKRGMSTGVKVVLILGIIFGVLAVVCCGIFGGIAWWAGKSMSEDPAVVRSTTKEITDIDIPPPLQPAVSMNLKLIMTMVMYADRPSNSSLVLFAAGEMAKGQNEQQMRQQFEQSMRQQSAKQPQAEQVLISNSYQKQYTIRGKPATFTIATGKGANSKTPRIEVNGTFEGKTGTVMLLLNADAQKLPEPAVIKMLESIK
jgi:hypothetical protein